MSEKEIKTLHAAKVNKTIFEKIIKDSKKAMPNNYMGYSYIDNDLLKDNLYLFVTDSHALFGLAITEINDLYLQDTGVLELDTKVIKPVEIIYKNYTTKVEYLETDKFLNVKNLIKDYEYEKSFEKFISKPSRKSFMYEDFIYNFIKKTNYMIQIKYFEYVSRFFDGDNVEVYVRNINSPVVITTESRSKIALIMPMSIQ